VSKEPIKSVMISRNEKVQSPWVWDAFANYTRFEMSDENGDLWVSCEDGHTIAIERKSPDDFINSVIDKRVFNQAEKMKSAADHCYIVINGQILPVDDPDWIKTEQSDGLFSEREFAFRAFEGAKLTLGQMNVFPVFCNGRNDFLSCIKNLAKRNKENIKIQPVRNAYVFGGQEAVLASLPGIGVKKAVDYLKLFRGNLGEAIMNLCHPESAKNIPGWGEKSAQTLKEFFNW